MKSEKEKAMEIAQLMDDGKGRDVTVIDVSQLNSWTDYFVIVTVNSSVHWKGLYKLVKDYVRDNDMEIHITNKKTSDGDDWNLIDIGTVVVHLMSEGARGILRAGEAVAQGRGAAVNLQVDGKGFFLKNMLFPVDKYID